MAIKRGILQLVLPWSCQAKYHPLSSHNFLQGQSEGLGRLWTMKPRGEGAGERERGREGKIYAICTGIAGGKEAMPPTP